MRISDWSSDVCSSDLLHLALVMAIDAKLLVLDEPTLGLDIVYRKQFYQNLLEQYFDDEKTILITTHQVEEIEHILTDLLFIRDGKISLSTSMDDMAERFVEVMVRSEEHTSELQSLMRISYAVFCLKKKNKISKNSTLSTQQTY